jgi:hypothetical protein
MSTFAVSHVKAGDSVGRGTVRQITWSALDYVSGNRVCHVSLGQNLLGQAMSQPTTNPATAPPPSGAAGDEDVLQRMMQRRAEELRMMQ